MNESIRKTAGAVLKLPRWIGEDRPELPPPRGANQIVMHDKRRDLEHIKIFIALHLRNRKLGLAVWTAMTS